MAFDIFAKLGDIKGESQDAKHKDEIEVLSFSWGVTSAPGAGTGGGAGKPVFPEFSMVHNIDKASPSLMKACATGKHLPEATITQRKAGKEQHKLDVERENKELRKRVEDLESRMNRLLGQGESRGDRGRAPLPASASRRQRTE